MQYLIEFSGEHRKLPYAELKAILEGCDLEVRTELDSPGVGLVRSPKSLKRIFNRPAMCRSISQLNFVSSEPTYESINMIAEKKVKDVRGTFAIDSRRIFGNHRELSLTQIKKDLGAVIISNSASGVSVNMKNPDTTFKLLMSTKCYFGKLLYDSNRLELEDHHGRNRPFFSPISLHPKLARAMVNLARVDGPMTLLDPFCGTGGILIEGATIGLKVYGSDLMKKMVDGSRQNLEKFHLPYEELFFCDIGEVKDIFNRVDAIVTDPPYGRSTTTSGERLDALYKRAFNSFKTVLKPKRFLVIMLPEEKHIGLGEKYLSLIEKYSVYVHKSLTRYVCVYQK